MRVKNLPHCAQIVLNATALRHSTGFAQPWVEVGPRESESLEGDSDNGFLSRCSYDSSCLPTTRLMTMSAPPLTR